MLHFDGATLLMVTAVVDAFATLIWATLALVFRIAPQGALMLAGSHAMIAIALWPIQGRFWTLGVSIPLIVTGVGLLALGVRRLTRLRSHSRDVQLITALALAAVLLSFPDGEQVTLVSSLAVGLLALLAARDVLVGSAFSPAITGLLATPYLALAGSALWRVPGLLGWVLLPEALQESLRHGASLALLRLLVNLGITTGLIALVLQRLLARIQHLTQTDGLTGLLNRRALEVLLQRFQAQVQRGHQHAVVVLDVDHFKRINDALGHAGGDAALQHLSQLLRSELRDADRFGRLGGEEFGILLPDTDQAGALLLAERLRTSLVAHPLQWEGRSWPLSASFGVSTLSRTDAQPLEALMRADAALYRAKALGRNRVESAETAA